ncbi:MAG: porin family protein [Deltaproteobacteria bacterium]|nr:porin family protein [Deltaproteobacteria bacterium]
MTIRRQDLRRSGHSMVPAAALQLLLLATSALFAGVAGAERPPPEYDRAGWYLGLGGFYALSDYDLTTSDLDVVPPQPADTNPKFGNSAGVDFRAGYRAFSRWAFEFDYQWQAGFDSKNSSIDPHLEIDTHLLSLNTKFFLLTGRWQPYALLGAGLLVFNSEIVDDDFKKPWDVSVGFAPRFGGGVDFWVNEDWALMLEGTYIVPVGILDGANMGSVGVGFQYRF